MHDALDLRELLGDEVIQRQESGYDLDTVLPQAEKVLQSDGPRWSAELEQAYRLLETAPVRPDWPYQEPQDEAAILAIPSAAATIAPPGDSELADRLHAAWLGRCAWLQPGQTSRGLRLEPRPAAQLPRAGRSYPICDYLPVLDPMPEGMTLNPSWRDASRGRISAMARDDDTDYTILGLHMLETYSDRLTRLTSAGSGCATCPSRRPIPPSASLTATSSRGTSRRRPPGSSTPTGSGSAR